MTATATTYLEDGPQDADWTLVLAHGAGAPMDSPFMNAFAAGLGEAGMRVLRFEFRYMAMRREDGKKRGPSRAPALEQEWHAVLSECTNAGRVAIGGKSMGGRIASMIADHAKVDALVCLGYPFHPTGKPEKLRTAHLAGLQTPTLIVQGERDPFGTKAEVEGYDLSSRIALHWLADGDHSFKPRKSSGRSQAQNWDEGIAAITDFLGTL